MSAVEELWLEGLYLHANSDGICTFGRHVRPAMSTRTAYGTSSKDGTWFRNCVQALAFWELTRSCFIALLGVQPPLLLGPAGIMDHVANCLELGVNPKQEPRDRAEGNNRQQKKNPHLANLPSEPKSTAPLLVLVQRECTFTPIRFGFASLADTIARPGAHDTLLALQAKTGPGFVAAFRFWPPIAVRCRGHASSYTMDPESDGIIASVGGRHFGPHLAFGVSG